MQSTHLHYFPIPWPFLAILALLAVFVLVLLEVRALTYAYEKIGISSRYVLALLLASILGSYINIPVAQLPEREVVSNKIVNFFGMQYVVPEVHQWPGTIIAVNLGGGVIPVVLSLYLLMKNGLYMKGLAGVVLVTAIVHWLASPVRGVGIAMPMLVPAVVAAIVGYLFSRRFAAAVAYIAGSLGTLIGADLLNLGKIQGLGAPVASIGGAGTFDGVFLVGIVAVLLTSDRAARRDAKRTQSGESTHSSGPPEDSA